MMCQKQKMFKTFEGNIIKYEEKDGLGKKFIKSNNYWSLYHYTIIFYWNNNGITLS